jgi:hypothetical protein
MPLKALALEEAHLRKRAERERRARLDAERLSGNERDILERVPKVGSDLLANIPRLQSVARIVLYQSKNYDGTGFPFDNVKGNEIPPESRILKALHAVAAMEAAGKSRFKAVERLRQETGSYDPKVLDTLVICFGLTTPAADAAAAPPRAVSFVELRPGHVLASDICTTDDIMVIGSGTKLTPFMMERLRNFSTLSGLREPIHILP